MRTSSFPKDFHCAPPSTLNAHTFPTFLTFSFRFLMRPRRPLKPTSKRRLVTAFGILCVVLSVLKLVTYNGQEVSEVAIEFLAMPVSRETASQYTPVEDIPQVVVASERHGGTAAGRRTQSNKENKKKESMPNVLSLKRKSRRERRRERRKRRREQRKKQARQTNQRNQTFPTIILLRAVGNALPPRHQSKQAYDNLEFTLQHEELFPNLKRHWFLNHIVDETVSTSLVNLLESHNESYTVIPLDLEHYRSIPYRFDRFPTFNGFPSHGNPQVDHDKIVYSINVNGVRNAMINYGKRNTTAEFILPWDGNAFLTRHAWESIVSGLLQHPKDNYFVVPMDRLSKSNTALLDPNYRPGKEEEAQIVFRRQSEALFNPNLRYGWRNKVELLSRMGRFRKIRWWYEWEKEIIESWNQKNPVRDLNRKKVPSIGWVARLSSGKKRKKQAEADVNLRGSLRSKGVIRLLMRIDARVSEEVMGLNSSSLLMFDKYQLKQVASGSLPIRDDILTLADASMQAPLSLGEPQFNKTYLPDKLLAHVTLLSLAFNATNNETYLNRTVAILEHWFTGTNTSLAVQYITNTTPSVVVHELRKLPWFFDALKLIKPAIPSDVRKRMGHFFRHLRILLENDKPNEAAELDQTTGLLFDMEVATLHVNAAIYDKLGILVDRAVARWSRFQGVNVSQCPLHIPDCEIWSKEAWSTFRVFADVVLGRKIEGLEKFALGGGDDSTSLFSRLAKDLGRSMAQQ